MARILIATVPIIGHVNPFLPLGANMLLVKLQFGGYVVVPTWNIDVATGIVKDGIIEPWTSWKNTLTAGQFTWPFGFELVHSSSSRELPER